MIFNFGCWILENFRPTTPQIKNQNINHSFKTTYITQDPMEVVYSYGFVSRFLRVTYDPIGWLFKKERNFCRNGEFNPI